MGPTYRRFVRMRGEEAWQMVLCLSGLREQGDVRHLVTGVVTG
jgi:hypothetical protein